MNAAAKKHYEKAQKLLRSLSIKKLCESFEIAMKNESQENDVVISWMTDEFERRDSMKFDAWIMCPNLNDLDHPSKFFLA